MFKKLWLLVSLVVVMSLTTGMAFGHWTDFANVNSTITTGNACVAIFGNPVQLDNGKDWTLLNQNAAINLLTNPLIQTNKDIGNCTLTIKDGDLIIYMSNIYPMYANEFSFDLYNCGTVPMELYGVTFIPINNTAATHFIPSAQLFSMDLTGDGINDIQILWAGATGNLLCPGTNLPLENSFYITFLEPIPQNITLALEIHVDFMNCES